MIKQWKRGVKLETMRIVEWVWYYILGLKRSISKHGEVLDYTIPQTYYITDIVQTLRQCIKNDSEKSKHKFHKPKIKNEMITHVKLWSKAKGALTTYSNNTHREITGTWSSQKQSNITWLLSVKKH